MQQIDDVRIQGIRPLMAPEILIEDLPVSESETNTISGSRDAIARILMGRDDRLLLVIGPCSIHDPEAALEYAARLAAVRERVAEDLLIVMRVYFEKPRTTVGWKGLINDPRLDGSFMIREGLRRARAFLLDVTELGLPIGSEFLDPIMPQFYADLVSWGAIGARTTESQVHRELASGLSMHLALGRARTDRPPGHQVGHELRGDRVEEFAAHRETLLGAIEKLSSMPGSLMRPFQPTVVRGFSK